MADMIQKHVLTNGMVVLGEPMAAVGSAAFDFMMPAGESVFDEGNCGIGNVIADWVFRGAGDRDSRTLGDELDGLGLHRGSGVGSSHITLGAALEAGNLSKAIDLYSDIILRPMLKADEFELSRQLSLQGLMALDDNPRQKVMLNLRERFYPQPFGRSSAGKEEDLKSLTAEKTAGLIKKYFNSVSQMNFAVAGKYDFDAVCGQLESIFGDLPGTEQAEIKAGEKIGGYEHEHNDGAQVHIGLMTGTVLPTDEDYYNARVAVSVLSGGMSARLFTEVREKRGLCYAVGASYNAVKQAAGISCYAGTTPEKGQETLDVIISEFRRLAEGISTEEIERAKVGLKSAVIMQSESSGSRSSAAGTDYYLLGRVRSLDEIKEKIEETSAESVLKFLRENKFDDFTLATIGPSKLSFEF